MSGPYVLLQVIDSGAGMTAKVLDHIFDPFFTTKELGKGTGLGLSTVYGIVRSYGGHVHCESRQGAGTTFKIYLPVHRDDALTSLEKEPLAEAGAGKTKLRKKGRETILFVDDEDQILSLATMMLEDNGYSVLQSSRGEQALDVYSSNRDKVNLVVLDLGMPGMGGLKCLRGLMVQNPQARVLIASGYASQDRVKEALEAGATGFLAKPYRLADLLGMVRKVLDM
jgi:CheY-like chemotaxis protein